MAVLVLALLGAALVAIGLPSDLLLVGTTPAEGEWSVPASQVRVVDGDTLRLGERTFRLYGLDAPERGQPCLGEGTGTPFDCGAMATAALARLVAEAPVSCRIHGRDRYGRSLGICEAGEQELNSALVSGGFAVADGSSLPALVPVEAAARLARRGLWAHGGFESPASWRRRR